MSKLHAIERFKNQQQFTEVKALVDRMVREGELKELGLDPAEPSRFVEMYQEANGETWSFAQPDHAFRGFLKLREEQNNNASD